MNVEIRQVYGHYELYIDGVFHGSFDSIHEAALDIEASRQEDSLQRA